MSVIPVIQTAWIACVRLSSRQVYATYLLCWNMTRNAMISRSNRRTMIPPSRPQTIVRMRVVLTCSDGSEVGSKVVLLLMGCVINEGLMHSSSSKDSSISGQDGSMSYRTESIKREAPSRIQLLTNPSRVLWLVALGPLYRSSALKTSP